MTSFEFEQQNQEFSGRIAKINLCRYTMPTFNTRLLSTDWNPSMFALLSRGSGSSRRNCLRIVATSCGNADCHVGEGVTGKLSDTVCEPNLFSKS